MGTIASALATGAATYAARKATPKTTYENYNFGGEDPNDPNKQDEDDPLKIKPQMAGTYLGQTNPQTGQPEPERIKAPWEKMVAGIGNGGSSYLG